MNADFSISLGLSTGGRGLHTAYKHTVCHQFSLWPSKGWVKETENFVYSRMELWIIAVHPVRIIRSQGHEHRYKSEA